MGLDLLNTSSLHRPVSPAVFLRRVMLFEGMLAFVQFIHLVLFANAAFGDFIAWMAVHAIALSSIALLRLSARDCTDFFLCAWKPLATIMIFTLAFKLANRIPIAQVWLAEGLYATRHSEELLGRGGWTSAINVFFYPSAILLAFCTLPRRVYALLMSGVLIMCAVDFIFIGTRNAPMFVLMLHVLAMPFRLGRRNILKAGLAVVLVTAIFNYSTVHRTQDSALGTFDWLTLFESTISTQVLTLNRATVEPIYESVPALMPAIFLSHYVSHPVAELNYFAGRSDQIALGGLYGIKDQFCAVGVCNREESQYAMEAVNDRSGVYQTMWAGLLRDFGWLGAAGLFLLCLVAVYGVQRMAPRRLGVGVILVAQLIALSSIENYLFNGLGLVQILCIFVVYQMTKRDVHIGFSLNKWNGFIGQ